MTVFASIIALFNVDLVYQAVVYVKGPVAGLANVLRRAVAQERSARMRKEIEAFVQHPVGESRKIDVFVERPPSARRQGHLVITEL